MADLYGEVNVAALTIALHDAGCDVVSFHERNESLESYYVNLVGDANHA